MKIQKKNRKVTITATSERDSRSLLSFLADVAGPDSNFAKLKKEKEKQDSFNTK